MEPWVTLAEAAVERVLDDSPACAFVDPHELALGGVTRYLVTHLGEGPDAVDRLMAGAERAAGMLDLLSAEPGAGP
jgi:hypothetical protein